MRRRLLGLAALAPLALVQTSAAQARGVVMDSVHRRPLGAATVIATPSAGLADTGFHAALTDARGRFAFEGLRSGRYLLTVEHPWIDSTGIGVPPVTVDVPAGGDVTTALGIPSTATLRRVFCPAALTDSTLGVMLGVVRGADGAPIPGARVVFRWSDFEVDSHTAVARMKELTAAAIADSVGVYRECGLPVARTLLVQAQADSASQSGVLEERIAEAGVLVRDFHLDPGEARAELGRYAVTGTVRAVAGQPVAGAQVRLFGTTRAVTTNDAGEFRLAGLAGGTQAVEVVALGYYPYRTRVEVGDATPSLAVRLERAAVVLDSMRIIAKRQRNPQAQSYLEFDDRAASGRGQYITEEEIARRQPFETSDLFKLVPGVKVIGFGSDAKIAAARGRATLGNTECPLDIFIDGVRAQMTDLNTLPPEALHGAEIYTVASAPAKYRVGACGALFLWTK
jgi:TonB-dependent Receptor Plug Domain.